MKIIKKKTVAFVGNDYLAPKHVSDRNLENVIRTELFYVIEELHKEGKNTFLSALRNGFEMLAAEAVLEYAQSHEKINLYAVVPLNFEKNIPVRYKRILEAVTGRLIVPESDGDDFLIENSSEVIVYGNSEEPGVACALNKAEQNGAETWNMYDELEGYFSFQNPVKQFLQDYPNVSSFRYGREGVIFQGHNQPFPVSFAEIAKVEEQNGLLCFKLKDGLEIMASLLSEACHVTLPTFGKSKRDFFC